MKELFFFAFFFTVAFSGCQKEPDRINNQAQTMVKRMELTSMGISSSFGGKDNIDFIYDNANRVASMIAYNVILFPNASYYDSIFRITFEYTGNNQLPSKVTLINHSNTNHEIHYFKYNGSGQPIVDSVLAFSSWGWGFARRSTYSYSGNSVLCQDSTSFGPGILTTIFSGFNGNYNNYGQPPVYQQSYEFDNGNNPLNKLNIAPIFFCLTYARRPIADIWSIWSFTNKNNITLVKLDFNSGLGIARDTTFLYNHYNSNGLLEKRYWCEQLYGTGTTFVDTIDMIKFMYQ